MDHSNHSEFSIQSKKQSHSDQQNISTPLNSPPKRRIVTPLFDPHGLGANLADSTDEEKEGSGIKDKGEKKNDIQRINLTDTGDINSDRRGRRRRSSEIVPIQSRSAEIAARDYSANNQGTIEETANSHSLHRDESISSQSSRLWWQRGDIEETNQNAENVQPSGMAQTPSGSMPRQRPKIDVEARSVRNRQASEGTNGSSQSPQLRSPAAAFLSSMNDMLASPPSSSSSVIWNPPTRNYSLSPARTEISQSYSGAISFDTTGPAMVNAISKTANQDSAGQFGLASAAAQLYNKVQASPSLHGISTFSGHPVPSNVKPDDEGARIGPGGRYLLGKTIGFGGFSTVREAWDLGENVTSNIVGDDDAKGWHRVAVKIVYGSDEGKKKDFEQEDDKSAAESRKGLDELELWKSIPAHPNLLPLLYHERMHLAEENMAGNSNKTIDFLVMPFCEGNLLTYVRMNGESLTEVRTQTPSRNGSTSGVELGRSLSTRSSRDDGKSDLIQSSGRYGRTGSGFIPHAHRANPIGDRVISAPLSALLARSSSLATSPASESSTHSTNVIQTGSLLRSTSVRMRQSSSQPSKGLPISVSKDIVHQITEALLCLHHKAGVLHGDLKLENVLGQQWIAPHSHLHSNSSENANSNEIFIRQRELTSSSSSSVPLMSPDAAMGIASICWRVADFGLASKIPSKEEEKREPQGHWIPSLDQTRQYNRRAGPHGHGVIAQSAANLRRHSSYAGNTGSTQSRSQAGSLAYAAPEVFLVPDTEDDSSTSPYASDMWALGCIIYALFAGRLPFSDTFEPRLQNKIIQGKWEMPERLKRRGQRFGKDAKMEDGSNSTVSEASVARANSFGESLRGRRQAFQLTALSGNQAEKAGSSSTEQAIDLSASMPTLPSRTSSSMTKSDSNQSMIFADQSDLTMSQEIDAEDPTSDDESTVDKLFDGISKDRVAIRRILRGLLEPDANKRWTVLQLSSDDWISSDSFKRDAVNLNDSLADGGLQSASQNEGGLINEQDLPSSLIKEFSKQPSDLVHPTIPENDVMLNTQQSLMPPEECEDVSTDEDSENLRRGRAPRRDDAEKDPMRKSRPIDIDRSQSRSRSRVRDDSPVWGMDIAPSGGGGFNWRQQQQNHQYHHQPFDSRPSDSRHPRQSWSARSSSVDQHSRGRKMDNGLGGSDREKSISANKEKRSGSRSGSGRGGSRSTSRGRRAELDLIMPQLSLHRSNLTSGYNQDQDVDESAEEELARVQSDDHNAERSSIWKSPLRARDRLVANLLGGGGSGQNSSGTNTPNKRASTQTPEEGSPSSGQRRNEDTDRPTSNYSNSPVEERPWWQRGRNTKH